MPLSTTTSNASEETTTARETTSMRCRSASHAGVELGCKTKLLDAENVLMTQACLGKCGRERNCSRGELQVTVYIPDGSALAVQSSMRHSHPLPSAASPLPVCAAVISATAVADVSVLTTDVQTPACSSSRPRSSSPIPLRQLAGLRARQLH